MALGVRRDGQKVPLALRNMGGGPSRRSSPYTAELYPTRTRGLGVSTASSMSRLARIFVPSLVGGILAATLGIHTVFVMFGIIAALDAIVLAMLGIETKNKSLEELSP